jgi:hypothetical protein
MSESVLVKERYIEVFSDIESKWRKTEFALLRNGDIFRIFDGETRYVNEDTGDNVWVAIGSPYINKDGILTVQTLF